MLKRLKNSFFILISTFLILYFFFNLMSGDRGLISYNEKKQILQDLKKKELLLIDQIKELESRTVDNQYINFTIARNNNKINIFFDKKTLNLIGWQTEDIYQNLVITYIYKIQYNQKIDKNIFKLPQMN